MRASPKVLVVDDHEPTRDGLRALLEQAGYTVSTASDGSDGLRLFKGDSPDLVLLDVKMPGISGLDVCAALKAHRSTCLTPVILISAVGDRDSQLAGLKAGADDFLNKPVDLEELYARVRSLLRIKRLTDDLESAELLFLSLGRIVEAREIVKVVDIFDALTTHRPYRRAMSRVKALQILQQDARNGGCSGSLVDRFVELHNSGGLVNPHLEQLAGHEAHSTVSSRELQKT